MISETEGSMPSIIQVDPDNITLLYVGRLSSEKNIPLAIKGVKRLSREYKGLKMILCGEGPARESLGKLARDLDVENRIFFLGYQKNIFSIMKACDLLVLPSFREGMSNVLFEALAAGLPVIASKIPPHEYWFKDRNIVSLFDPYSITDICEKISTEIHRPDVEKEFRRKEAEKLVRTLDVSVMGQRYADYYVKLLKYHKDI
jgi:glycosyltransferase involved in cell wall biosynthesis